MKLKFALLITGILAILNASAQDAWSLERCIEQAVGANLDVKRSELNLESQEYNLQQSRAQVLPTLNAFASHGYNWGQRIDPFTNTFASSRVRSNSFSVQANLTLFNGLQTYNNIKRSELLVQSNVLELEARKNDIRLAVASGYLTILFNEELVSIAESQLTISKQQLERVEKLVGVGQSARGTMLDLQAQVANDELNLVNQQNQLQLSYLNMVQLLMLDGEKARTFKIVVPNLQANELPNLAIRVDEVFNAALSTRPEIQASELRILSAQRSLASAKGGYSPRLSLGVSYGSGYSGLAQRPIDGSFMTGFDTLGYTANTFEPVLVPSFTYDTETTPFWDQINDNTNTNLNFTLSIPIFNGLQVRTNVQQARIQMETEEINLEAQKNTLRTNINQAYADVMAALKSYDAANDAYEARKEAFKYAQIRYEQSMINTVEFNDSKNNLARAESEVIRAKYDYIFKTKILDFYQGKPISM